MEVMTGEWQRSLFGGEDPEPLPVHPHRRQLDSACWLDLQSGWMRGHDQLFDELVAALPWRRDTRPMYDRIVAVPRLTAFLAVGHPCVPPVVRHAAAVLSHHYAVEFSVVGANLYRDGADSVAWHADRIARRVRDPLIAIASLGGCRTLRFRPAEGGEGVGVDMFGGDLLVMGGACQHRWQHAVPKRSHAEPRMILTFRHDDG
jgi:alkylated DNA repair dioxygenase AlkB